MTIIERLETAGASSGELDGEIAYAVDWQISDDCGWREYFDTYPKIAMTDENLPHYTTSVDDALTLVPEGWVWIVQTDYELPGRAGIYCADPDGTDNLPVNFTADAATPALALCVAALKALEYS